MIPVRRLLFWLGRRLVRLGRAMEGTAAPAFSGLKDRTGRPFRPHDLAHGPGGEVVAVYEGGSWNRLL